MPTSHKNVMLGSGQILGYVNLTTTYACNSRDHTMTASKIPHPKGILIDEDDEVLDTSMIMIIGMKTKDGVAGSQVKYILRLQANLTGYLQLKPDSPLW